MKLFGKQIWWCNICDEKQVDSTKPETGSYYMLNGVEHPASGNDACRTVIFAVCCHCNLLNAARKINVEHLFDRIN
jgi:hypothetical protein